nr:PREDICTED: peroxisomal (S)-2-hydroxy-acid oxidase GLO4-like [Bemisia tabaci]
MGSDEMQDPSLKSLFCIQDVKDCALKGLPQTYWDYFARGAANEVTLANNELAFQKFRIRPRVMVDVSQLELETSVLGERVAFPVGISPSALHELAHPEGESATAVAAGEQGTIYIQSTLSSQSLEEVGAAAPKTTKWLQLFIFHDKDITKSLVARAEKAGFKAIVVTVDIPIISLRKYGSSSSGPPFPDHLRFANLTNEKCSLSQTNKNSGGERFDTKGAFNPRQTWDDIKWLKSITKLPVVLKGILTREDAILGADAGADGILVSNHGGRQLDGSPATIEALPEIVEAVGDKVEVYLDGGVRGGADVFIALALGAKMVFIGRPAVWGLAVGGQDGVKKVLDIFKYELSNVMALSGAVSPQQITNSMVVHESYYSKFLR